MHLLLQEWQVTKFSMYQRYLHVPPHMQQGILGPCPNNGVGSTVEMIDLVLDFIWIDLIKYQLSVFLVQLVLF